MINLFGQALCLALAACMVCWSVPARGDAPPSIADLEKAWLTGLDCEAKGGDDCFAGLVEQARQKSQVKNLGDRRKARALAVCGCAMWKQGRLNQAKQDLQQSLKLYPYQHRARACLGGVLVDKGRPNEALEQLDKAIEHNPWEPYIYIRRGEAHLAAGHPEAAESDSILALSADHGRLSLSQKLAALNIILQIDPENVDALFHKSTVLYQLNRLDKSLDLIERVLKLDPAQSSALYQRAVILRDLGGSHYKEALATLNKAEPNLPSSYLFDFYLLRSQLLYRQQNYESALIWANKAVDITPFKLDPRNASSSPLEAGGYIIRSLIYDKLGKYEKALSDLELALKAGPSTAYLQIKHLEILRKVGKHQRVLQIMGRYINSPSYSKHVRASARIERAKTYVDQKKYSDAMADLDRAIQLEPSNHNAHAQLVRILLEQGKLEQALLAAEKAIEGSPKDPRNFALQIKVLMELKDFPGAIESARKLCSLVPKEECALGKSHVAQIYAVWQSWEKCLELAEQALELNPNLWQGMYFKALALFNLDLKQDEASRTPEAKALLQECLEQKNALIPARFWLARIHLFQREYPEAEMVLLEALQSLKDKEDNLESKVELLGLLAQALVRQEGRFQQAEEKIDEALQLEPDDPKLFAKLLLIKGQVLDEKGTDLAERGEVVGAKKAWREAVDHYTRALNKRGIYLEAWIMRGLASARQQEFRQAADDLRRIKMYPDQIKELDQRYSELLAALQGAVEGKKSPPAKQGARMKRYALVVGNGEYDNPQSFDRLDSALRDAKAVHEKLADLGYLLPAEPYLDLNRNQLHERIKEFLFGNKPEPGSLVVVYYSGHGVWHNNDLYLIPKDAQAQYPVDLDHYAYPLSRLLEMFAGREDLFKVVIVDACRSPSGWQGGQPGKQDYAKPANTLLWFATQAGERAWGGEGLSPFTAALLKQLGVRGLEIKEMAAKVRLDMAAAGHAEVAEPFGDTLYSINLFLNPEPALQGGTMLARAAIMETEDWDKRLFVPKIKFALPALQ